MALKLDEDYNGSTLLSEWWQKVKSNFAVVKTALEQEVTDRNTAITTAIAGEVTSRNSAIAQAINKEASDRNAAIKTAIGEEETSRNSAIDKAVADEAGKRESADKKLQDNIDAEAKAREAEDAKLSQQLGDLETFVANECHTHDNKTVLDRITSQKINEWNNKLGNLNNYKVEYDSEYGIATITNLQGPIEDGYYLFTSEIDISDVEVHDEESGRTTLSTFDMFAGQTAILKAVDNELTMVCNIVSDTMRASTEQYGVVKLRNISGLSVDNGAMTVNTNTAYGTIRTADNQVGISSASDNDIDARSSNYKPIVPKNLEYAVNSVTGKYCTTPVQVGRWIDGTPIWRIAFNIDVNIADFITKYNTGDKFEYGLPWVFEEYLTDVYSAFIHNYQARVRMDTPCHVDDVNLVMGGTGYVACDIASLNLNQNGHDGIYGFVEFVTPADNIVADTNSVNETDE